LSILINLSPYSVLTQSLTKKQIGVKILAENVEYLIARMEISQLKETVEKMKSITDAKAFVSAFEEM
jgi:hypothetical protein